MKRRTIISSVVLVPALGHVSSSKAAGTSARLEGPQRPITRLDPLNIQRDFPLAVEQAFAKRTSRAASIVLSRLSTAELHDLAIVYNNAVTNAGHSPRLLDILVPKLPSVQLADMSRHFGFAPVYQSIARFAPVKLADYRRLADAQASGPSVGQLPSRARLHKKDRANLDLAEFFNYTPYETYLAFRTSPVGALGPAAAAFETGLLWVGAAQLAYGGGFAVGNYFVAPLVQTYAPTLWDAIGGTIGAIFERIQNASDTWGRGAAEGAGAISFQLGPISLQGLEAGGDFGVSGAMEYWAANGGGSNPGGGGEGGGCGGAGRDGGACPILL